MNYYTRKVNFRSRNIKGNIKTAKEKLHNGNKKQTKQTGKARRMTHTRKKISALIQGGGGFFSTERKNINAALAKIKSRHRIYINELKKLSYYITKYITKHVFRIVNSLLAQNTHGNSKPPLSSKQLTELIEIAKASRIKLKERIKSKEFKKKFTKFRECERDYNIATYNLRGLTMNFSVKFGDSYVKQMAEVAKEADEATAGEIDKAKGDEEYVAEIKDMISGVESEIKGLIDSMNKEAERASEVFGIDRYPYFLGEVKKSAEYKNYEATIERDLIFKMTANASITEKEYYNSILQLYSMHSNNIDRLVNRDMGKGEYMNLPPCLAKALYFFTDDTKGLAMPAPSDVRINTADLKFMHSDITGGAVRAGEYKIGFYTLAKLVDNSSFKTPLDIIPETINAIKNLESISCSGELCYGRTKLAEMAAKDIGEITPIINDSIYGKILRSDGDISGTGEAYVRELRNIIKRVKTDADEKIVGEKKRSAAAPVLGADGSASNDSTVERLVGIAQTAAHQKQELQRQRLQQQQLLEQQQQQRQLEEQRRQLQREQYKLLHGEPGIGNMMRPGGEEGEEEEEGEEDGEEEEAARRAAEKVKRMREKEEADEEAKRGREEAERRRLEAEGRKAEEAKAAKRKAEEEEAKRKAAAAAAEAERKGEAAKVDAAQAAEFNDFKKQIAIKLIDYFNKTKNIIDEKGYIKFVKVELREFYAGIIKILESDKKYNIFEKVIVNIKKDIQIIPDLYKFIEMPLDDFDEDTKKVDEDTDTLFKNFISNVYSIVISVDINNMDKYKDLADGDLNIYLNDRFKIYKYIKDNQEDSNNDNNNNNNSSGGGMKKKNKMTYTMLNDIYIYNKYKNSITSPKNIKKIHIFRK